MDMLIISILLPLCQLLGSYTPRNHQERHIARGLSSLGLTVDLHSSVGDDNEGKCIIRTLSEDGIDTSGIIEVEGRNTLTKIRFYGSRENLLDQEQILLQADPRTSR